MSAVPEDVKALKPCPHCGLGLRIRKGVNGYGRCVTEGCFGKRMPVVSFADAQMVAEWNTRAARPSVPPAPDAREEAIREDERLMWFMTLMDACGSRGAECSDDRGEWIAVFCGDFEPIDTFNRASDIGLISVSHNDMFDTSHCRITDAGKVWLSERKRLRAETGEV